MASGRKLIKYWLPVILWMCLIFWMSTSTFAFENTASLVKPVLRFLVPRMPAEHMDLIHALIRKTGHVTEYFILGLLLLRAFRAGDLASWNWRWSLSALVFVFLWAASDEFHQSFVPTRSASIADVGLDTSGGILAQFVGLLWHRYGKRWRHR